MVLIIITFHKLNFVSSKKIRIKEYWIMSIKNQLRMMNINIIIVEDIDDAH